MLVPRVLFCRFTAFCFVGSPRFVLLVHRVLFCCFPAFFFFFGSLRFFLGSQRWFFWFPALVFFGSQRWFFLVPSVGFFWFSAFFFWFPALFFRLVEATFPKLVRPRARARLVVLVGDIGGRWSEETRTFIGWPVCCRRWSNSLGGSSGDPSWRTLHLHVSGVLMAVCLVGTRWCMTCATI